MQDILQLAFYLLVLIFSVMIHEVAHGITAFRLGDPTAKLAGRLTFNPLKHIDPFGSVLFPFLLFIAGLPIIGWAKPVPYNPYNLTKDYKYGPLKVALAGPFSNLFILLIFGLLARVAAGTLNPITIGLFGFIAYLNVLLAIFNLLPLPPLDGSRILPLLLPARYAQAFERVGIGGILLVFLFLFLFSGIINFLVEKLFLLVAGPDVLFMTNNVVQQIFSS
jgi:Zn-dependent protease